MLEQALLRERFENLLKAEQQAQLAYQEVGRLVADPAQLEQIQQVIRDKQRHIELAQRLLELVD